MLSELIASEPAGADPIGLAAAVLSRSRHAVAMTGAGISVDSGVPTFQGADGLWTRFGRPAADTYARFKADPEAWWRREVSEGAARYAIELRRTLALARPNAAHLALVALERDGVLKGVVTQNIDGLHIDAGSKSVIEIHGSRRNMRCVGCGARTPRTRLTPDRAPDPCAGCGGPVKYDSVMFGEPIPPAVLAAARAETELADCILAVGTSATVRPASGLAWIAKANGARLIEVNPSQTRLSRECDVVVRASAAEALPAIAAALESPAGGQAGMIRRRSPRRDQG